MKNRVPFSLTMIAATASVLLASCSPAGSEPDPGKVFQTDKAKFRVVRVAGSLEHPWSLAFLPNGDMLVTERAGRLRLISGGKVRRQPIAGVPAVVASGQGGLLDVILDPGFAKNRLIYLSYAGRQRGGANTHVMRARYSAKGLTDQKVIFRAEPAANRGVHYGSRLAFGRDGMLYVTVGERGDPDRAQDLSSHNGSVIRIRPDGSVPPDNPFVGEADVRPEIYSYGHRNPQGLAVHPDTGAVWAQEHGPRGGDEVNLIRRGVNYGWPVITFGRAYSGFSIGEGTHKTGMAQPMWKWVPSIAPSGMMFYSGTKFPGWRGNLFVGALKDELVARLEMKGGKIVSEERLLTGAIGRIRDLRQGPDGLVYLLNDESDGAVYRLEPAG